MLTDRPTPFIAPLDMLTDRPTPFFVPLDMLTDRPTPFIVPLDMLTDRPTPFHIQWGDIFKLNVNRFFSIVADDSMHYPFLVRSVCKLD